MAGLAKLCNVTDRTVQYYDKRNYLIPVNFLKGRRLLRKSDLQRLKSPFVSSRELDVPIDAISQLLEEEHPEKESFPILMGTTGKSIDGRNSGETISGKNCT